MVLPRRFGTAADLGEPRAPDAPAPRLSFVSTPRLDRVDPSAHTGCIFHGSNFRGKISMDLVRAIAGVDLEQDWIPPDTVAVMADAFEDFDRNQVLRKYESLEWHPGHSPAAITSLACFFRICADRHLGLVGAW